jgi:hypothetical protein
MNAISPELIAHDAGAGVALLLQRGQTNQMFESYKGVRHLPLLIQDHRDVRRSFISLRQRAAQSSVLVYLRLNGGGHRMKIIPLGQKNEDTSRHDPAYEPIGQHLQHCYRRCN